MVKKTQRRKDPCVLTVRQEILNYASRTENTMKGLDRVSFWIDNQWNGRDGEADVQSALKKQSH